MKFYLDSANVAEIQSACRWGIIDGVTTNPSLIAKEGVAVEDQVRRICAVFDGDVSASVTCTTERDIIEEGRRLSRIHKNIVVKVPLTAAGISAVSALAKEGIRCNVTLCFSAAQALIAAKAGAYIVSPFVGRIDDIGLSGIDVVRDIAAIYRNYGFNTQILAASVRGAMHLIEVAKIGAHIVTLPYNTLEQLFAHPLTDKGIQQFLSDHRKAFDLATA